MVVTDDRGRYLSPGLPQATYSVWVRGYGLVDSSKINAKPGNFLDLTAAPSATAAAEYYPASIGIRCCEFRTKASFRAPALAFSL